MKRSPIALLALLLFYACAPKAEGEVSRTDFVLGTVCTVRLLEGGSTKTTDEVFARLTQIENRMSANKDGTEIAAVNSGAGGAPVKVSEDTFYVISQALRYAELSGGAFDPTIGPFVKLWNIGDDSARIPSKAEIAAALPLVGYRNVELNQSARTVRLAKAGMRLDLGAIAKGYAADEVAAILEKHGVKAAVVDLGGNVLVYGKKKDASPWRVGIQDPKTERGEYLGLVTGGAMTVVTSGIYERFFIQDGVRYHHILSTSTGYPINNGLVSVSIMTGRSIDADALSTSVFALGLDAGRKLVESLPGVYAIFVDTQDKVHMSAGAEKIFSLSSKAYSLAK